MLVNKNKDTTNHVKFVSYTGRYPNLCSGVLTLEIDGEEVKFGNNYTWDEELRKYAPNGNYDSFWTSGGSCGFTNGYENSYCHDGEWYINVKEIPEQFRQYASEIDEVFNDNVDWGCCGGCL